MTQPNYRSIRGKLVAREKQCRRSIKQMLRRRRDFIPSGVHPPDDDDVDMMVAQIIAATSVAQHRSQDRGFDGYKYAVVTTQLKYSKGFTSRGKKYAQRIYLVTALELFLYAARSMGEREALTSVEVAAQGNITSAPIHADMLARTWRWDRSYNDHYAVWAALVLDGLSGASLHRTLPWEDFEPDFTGGGPWGYQSGQGGYRPEPEPEPQRQPRPNEWAYAGEPALNDGRTWQQVLFGNDVPYAASSIDDIRKQWKKKMRSAHPDAGGTNEEAAAANAAWAVAQKLLGPRYH